MMLEQTTVPLARRASSSTTDQAVPVVRWDSGFGSLDVAYPDDVLAAGPASSVASAMAFRSRALTTGQSVVSFVEDEPSVQADSEYRLTPPAGCLGTGYRLLLMVPERIAVGMQTAEAERLETAEERLARLDLALSRHISRVRSPDQSDLDPRLVELVARALEATRRRAGAR